MRKKIDGLLTDLFLFFRMLESYIFPSKLTYCPSVACFVIKGVPNFWAIVSEIFVMGVWYVKLVASFVS